MRESYRRKNYLFFSIFCYSFNDPYLSFDINRILILSIGILFLKMFFGCSRYEQVAKKQTFPQTLLQIDFLELHLHTSILL